MKASMLSWKNGNRSGRGNDADLGYSESRRYGLIAPVRTRFCLLATLSSCGRLFDHHRKCPSCQNRHVQNWKKDRFAEGRIYGISKDSIQSGRRTIHQRGLLSPAFPRCHIHVEQYHLRNTTGYVQDLSSHSEGAVPHKRRLSQIARHRLMDANSLFINTPLEARQKLRAPLRGETIDLQKAAYVSDYRICQIHYRVITHKRSLEFFLQPHTPAQRYSATPPTTSTYT